MSVCIEDFVLTELFMETMLDTNKNKTRNLILNGNDLMQKIGRRIQDGDMERISLFLTKHPEVVSLEFPYNEIGNCGMYTLMRHIKDYPTIIYMNMIGNRIRAEGVKAIVELGENLPLYVLRLSGNKIGDEGGKLLSKILYLKTSLKVLEVSDCHQTISGISYILTGLMYNRGGTDTLEVIDIGKPLQQSYHKMCDAHVAEFFGQAIHFNTSLKEFRARQYQLDFRDMEIFLNGLMMNRTLQILDLNNNNIGDDGVDYVCMYLRSSPPLAELMIGANNIGDKGARSLSNNLPYSNLKLLDISNNHITDSGILHILYTIIKIPPLKALFIWGNIMNHKSLKFLQQLLNDGVLDQNNLDIKPYDEEDLKAAWNSSAEKCKGSHIHSFQLQSFIDEKCNEKSTKNRS